MMVEPRALEKRSSPSLSREAGVKEQKSVSPRKEIRAPTEYQVLAIVQVVACYEPLFITPIADITFEVKDKPHPLFKRDGIDLVYKAKIPLLVVSILNQDSNNIMIANDYDQALTGGAVEIPTLDGRKISIPINEIVRYI